MTHGHMSPACNSRAIHPCSKCRKLKVLGKVPRTFLSGANSVSPLTACPRVCLQRANDFPFGSSLPDLGDKSGL